MLKNKIKKYIYLLLGLVLVVIFAFSIFQLLFFVLLVGIALFIIMRIPGVKNWLHNKIVTKIMKKFEDSDYQKQEYTEEHNFSRPNSSFNNFPFEHNNSHSQKRIKDITSDSKIINP